MSYYGSGASKAKASAQQMSIFIQKITEEHKLLTLLASNAEWENFLILYIRMERRELLGEHAVLYALRNYFYAGLAKALNQMGELTRLGALQSPPLRRKERPLSEEQILRHLETVDGDLRRQYEEKLKQRFGDIIRAGDD